MSINWWNWLPAWAKELMTRIASPVVEGASGLVTVTLAYALVKLGILIVSKFTVVDVSKMWILILTAILAHVLSAIYEAFIDSNGWEWKDLGQREVGIIFALTALFALLQP